MQCVFEVFFILQKTLWSNKQCQAENREKGICGYLVRLHAFINLLAGQIRRRTATRGEQRDLKIEIEEARGGRAGWNESFNLFIIKVKSLFCTLFPRERATHSKALLVATPLSD